MEVKDRVAELRKQAAALQAKNQIVEYEGLSFDCYAPTMRQMNEARKFDLETDPNALVRYLILNCVKVPGTNEPVFTDAEAVDNLPWDAVKAIGTPCLSLFSGKNAEILKGNSNSTPADADSTG